MDIWEMVCVGVNRMGLIDIGIHYGRMDIWEISCGGVNRTALINIRIHDNRDLQEHSQ